MLSNEDYEFIKQYETTYKKAKEQNYAHILPRSINERLNSIIGGENKNWGCSACCLTLYRKLYTVLKNETAQRQAQEIKTQQEKADRMAKAREAKKYKQQKKQEDAKKKRPE